MDQKAYIPTMENGGGTVRAVRNQVYQSHRKEHILSYTVPAPQNPRNAHSATTATTPLQIGPTAPESHVASIADNPSPSRNDFKIKRLRCGIIGDARSPIIAHPIHGNPRNNCNNPLRNGPSAPEALVALIADNPLPSHNSCIFKHLRFGIIGDGRSPIIAHPSHGNLRNNCNNPPRIRHKLGIVPLLLIFPLATGLFVANLC